MSRSLWLWVKAVLLVAIGVAIVIALGYAAQYLVMMENFWAVFIGILLAMTVVAVRVVLGEKNE